MEARLTLEPASNRRMLMGGVVVHDEMKWPIRQSLLIQMLQEPQLFLMAVLRLTGADDLAREDMERGEERGGAVPFIVMGHGPAPPLLHGQPGLGAIQGLDLILLVRTEDQGFVGRIEIESDHIRRLLDELRVSPELEGACLMRLEAMELPDAVDGFGAHPHHRSQRPGRPMSGGQWRGRCRQGHNALDRGGPNRGRPARARCILFNAGPPVCRKACPPAAHTLPVGVQLCRDSRVHEVSRRPQHILGAQDHTGESPTSPGPTFQGGPFVRGQGVEDGTSYREYLLRPFPTTLTIISHRN